MRRLEKIFKAAGDRNRLRILKILEVKPMCVCEITEIVGIAQSSVSRHLSILRDAGFLTDEKVGLWVNYSLITEEDGVVTPLLKCIRRWELSDAQFQEDKRKAALVDRNMICRRP